MCSKEYQTYFQRRMKRKNFHLSVAAGLSFSDAPCPILGSFVGLTQQLCGFWNKMPKLFCNKWHEYLYPNHDVAVEISRFKWETKWVESKMQFLALSKPQFITLRRVYDSITWWFGNSLAADPCWSGHTWFRWKMVHGCYIICHKFGASLYDGIRQMKSRT